MIGPQFSLEGRVAVVTGAGQGIGEAIAHALAAAGASVLAADLDAARVEGVAAAIQAAGRRASAVRADVTVDAGTLAQAALDRFGGLDILVNNAGLGLVRPFMDTTAEDMERIMRVNLIGPMLCAQAALRIMLPRRWGRIINIASISGQRGGVGRTAYGASKAAVELMSKVMAVELGGTGVTVNAVAPGPVETAMTAAMHDDAQRAAYHAQVPERRYGRPDEIAAACVFLASDAAAYVCGHTLNVDGGFGAAGLMA